MGLDSYISLLSSPFLLISLEALKSSSIFLGDGLVGYTNCTVISSEYHVAVHDILC